MHNCIWDSRLVPSSTALLAPTEPKPIFLGADVAGFAPPVCPKPSLATPMPSLSTSLSLFLWPWVAPKPPALPGLSGVGDAILVFSEMPAVLSFVSATACSASGSYPSFSIRSASSFAFFSAASKSRASPPPSFLAPSFCVFFAPRTLVFLGAPVIVVFRIAAEGIARGAAEPICEASESALTRGDLGLIGPLPFAPG